MNEMFSELKEELKNINTNMKIFSEKVSELQTKL